ncbi:hypothetical protein BDU57DRAFT_520046 [Ampelomyces quisqualis]|uniref:Uncharacterized protein n=1 Tax=Ampelomyces quisqualis TaxID=50730 RepID=A0A6A5QJ64_AMPQU|nr:hypothetical protein BDU57DRAFT_520046 [Ampelomyces quisqualis]
MALIAAVRSRVRVRARHSATNSSTMCILIQHVSTLTSFPLCLIANLFWYCVLISHSSPQTSPPLATPRSLSKYSDPANR